MLFHISHKFAWKQQETKTTPFKTILVTPMRNLRCCATTDGVIFQPVIRHSTYHTPLLIVSIIMLVTFVNGQTCKTVGRDQSGRASWRELVEALNDSNGIAILCPFEISGDRCSDETDVLGYSIAQNMDLLITCDERSNSGCTINCPHRHFTAHPYSSLTLDRIHLHGSTKTSIAVQKSAKLRVINSMFDR